MSEWTTSVKIAVTAILLIVTISLLIGIVYMSLLHINKNSEKVNTTLYSQSKAELIKYDDTEISGSEVINAIDNYKEYCILVKYPCNLGYCMAFNKGIADNSWQSDGKYNKTVLPSTAVLKDMYSELRVSNKADDFDSYINPAARFRANLLKTQNGEVIGLTFSHQN